MMKYFFLFTVLFFSTTFTKTYAQMSTEELAMQSFARAYMTAYNQQDTDALRGMYSEYISRTDQQGETIVGLGAVMDHFAKEFRLNNATLLLRPSRVHWSDAEHAWISSGTYEIFGITNVYDIPVHTTGIYTHTMIKEKDQWKIAKTVLTPVVKILVYQEVEDIAKWTSTFTDYASLRGAQGEAGAETGVVPDHPNTVYYLGQWPSSAAFQDFVSDVKYKDLLREAGVVGQPTVLVLAQE